MMMLNCHRVFRKYLKMVIVLVPGKQILLVPGKQILLVPGKQILIKPHVITVTNQTMRMLNKYTYDVQNS